MYGRTVKHFVISVVIALGLGSGIFIPIHAGAWSDQMIDSQPSSNLTWPQYCSFYDYMLCAPRPDSPLER
jgi:hypothetical protein